MNPRMPENPPEAFSKIGPWGVENGLPEASGGLLVARWRAGGEKGESEIVKKNHLSRPGGLQKSSWIIFQRLEPPPG